MYTIACYYLQLFSVHLILEDDLRTTPSSVTSCGRPAHTHQEHALKRRHTTTSTESLSVTSCPTRLSFFTASTSAVLECLVGWSLAACKTGCTHLFVVACNYVYIPNVGTEALSYGGEVLRRSAPTRGSGLLFLQSNFIVRRRLPSTSTCERQKYLATIKFETMLAGIISEIDVNVTGVRHRKGKELKDEERKKTNRDWRKFGCALVAFPRSYDNESPKCRKRGGFVCGFPVQPKRCLSKQQWFSRSPSAASVASFRLKCLTREVIRLFLVTCHKLVQQPENK